MSTSAFPDITLNNGVRMPQLGFGTYKVGGEATAAALAAGYRSIDTAEMYGNEEEIGRALAESGIPREELFVTSKVWNDHHGYQATLDAFEGSRRRLGLDYLDLYLIHWPQPQLGLHAETWRALEKLLADGAVRAIGVSNFTPQDLDELLRAAGTVPAVNQIELNPYRPRAAEREYHARHGIATQAWAPLARAGDLLAEPAVREAAEAHGRTPAQVVIRWHLQTGTIAIPRSSDPGRIAANADVMGFRLSDEEMARLTALGN